MPDSEKLPTKTRLLLAAKRLFAEKGFAGASVRDICTEANAGRNMIHHYFGNKEKLFDAILDGFSNETFVVPLRIISEPATSRAELVFKLEHFVRESLEALIEQRLVFRILIREQTGWQEFGTFRDGLLGFLRQARQSGFVQPGANIDLIPGLILDRLGNQVLFAEMSGQVPAGSAADNTADNVVSNPEYRRKWVKDSVALILFGFVAPEP